MLRCTRLRVALDKSDALPHLHLKAKENERQLHVQAQVHWQTAKADSQQAK